MLCKNSLFYDLGNCISNCSNGVLINNNCKCSYDIKCELCTKESILLNKCITCNTEEGYYKKSNDKNNLLLLIECYNNNTISDDYYLNTTLNSYEPCYNTCMKCSKFGDKNNHNCDKCISSYSFLVDNKNNKNCYKECDYYYYFDSYKNYYCTEDNKCPPNFNKLIFEKKRCINNCNNDRDYKYEYQNGCYSQCPLNTIANENNVCILKESELKCPEDYPYEMIQDKKCVKECNITYLLNNICKINNPIAKVNSVNDIKNSIKDGTLDDILEK